MSTQSPLLAQAIQLFSRGAYPQAISLLQQAVAAQPVQLESRLQLAKASLDWVQTQAQTPLTDIKPETLSVEALHYLQLAESHLDVLSKTYAAAPRVQNLLAMVHLIHARYTEALRCLKKAQAKDPLNPDLMYNIGYALMEMKRYCEAAAQFKRLTALHSEHGMGWHMLGEATRLAGKLEAALSAYRRAITLLPGWFQPYGALGSALRDLERYDEAMAAMRKGLSVQPDNLDLNFTLANCELSIEAWTTGWGHYACRISAGRRLPFPEDYAIPLQPGQPVRVHYDQGLGDELFFLRFVPALVAKGLTIHYTTHRKLFPLLQGQPDIAELKAADSGEPEPYDVLVGDLPFLAGMRSSASIPPSLALRLDDERARSLREALAAFGPPPYMGITWQGGKIKEVAHKGSWRLLHKEIAPAMLGRIARDWPGTVVVLQRAPRPEDVASFSKALGRPWLDWSRLNDDLQDTLAGLSLLNEYVGVSNTNMHLLAGINKTARVLVPQPADWRWMAKGEESPWFPGFAVYRQARDGDWRSALEKLQADLHGACSVNNQIEA
jgi:Flp pilus assembly protein TadD